MLLDFLPGEASMLINLIGWPEGKLGETSLAVHPLSGSIIA